jgi:hypothetical protein
MRALSGAIITAAALIALGLTTQGIGTRYAHRYVNKSADGDGSSLATETDWDKTPVRIRDLDNAVKVALFFELGLVLIGLATTFLGLAYHHHRRHHEHLHRAQANQNPRLTV